MNLRPYWTFAVFLAIVMFASLVLPPLSEATLFPTPVFFEPSLGLGIKAACQRKVVWVDIASWQHGSFQTRAGLYPKDNILQTVH